MGIAYDDNRVIRPDLEYEWSKEMIQEYTKCAKSSTYFALNHAVAIHPMKGIIPLEVRSYQLSLLDKLSDNKLVLGLYGRQSGKSLILCIHILHMALYSDKPVNIFMLAHKGDMSKQLLMDLKVIYEELPPYLKKGVKKYDATTIEFEDGSKIRSGTTTPDTIRGQSISFLLLDEFAFVQPHIVDGFWTSAQPTLSTGGSCCVISTPNGASGLFYELYKGAKNGEDGGEGNGFKLSTVDYKEVPRGKPIDEWEEETINTIGQVRFNQEYKCLTYDNYINIIDTTTGKKESIKIGELYERENKKKRKYKIETPFGYVDFIGIDKKNNKQETFIVKTKNYSCEVSKTHNFVIDGEEVSLTQLKKGDYIETINGKEKIVEIIYSSNKEVYDVLSVNNVDKSFYSNGILHHNCAFLGSSNTLISGDSLESISNDIVDYKFEYDGGDFKVWYKPKKDKLYVMGVDVAKGVGKDYSVIQVVDVTHKNKYKQVAVYRNNFIRPEIFTKKIDEIGKIYNNAYLIVENNTFGHQICIDLWDEFEYENMFKEYGKREHGVTANVKSKSKSTSNLKTLLEENILTIYDKQTYKELSGFVETKPNVYSCEGAKAHDDLVMGLVWVCYFLNNPFWKDLEEFERQSLGLDTSDFKEKKETNENSINIESSDFEPYDFSNMLDDKFDW